MEKIKARWRVLGIDFSASDVIKDKTTANAAEWTEQPNTLRDDELTITSDAPDEDPIYSHEYDNAVDMSYTGKGQTMGGSFFNMTTAQLVGLVGGEMDGTAFVMPESLLPIDKAVRVRFHGGGWVVFPKVSGYVTLDMNIGVNGRVKAPFKLTPVISKDGIVGIWETDTSAAVPAPKVMEAPAGRMANAPVPPKDETKK